MEVIGYIALCVMGITLGLVGAGGSILTIPILVYFLDIPMFLATSYSLVVVGSSSFFAAIRYRHNILFKKATQFLIPSVLGVFATRYFIIPNLPNSVYGIPMDRLFMVLLLSFMGFAGYVMIKNVQENNLKTAQGIKIIAIGGSLGILMGLLGSGGGFLIVPTLVLLMGFTMPQAVATSLLIITINSGIGFAADKHHFLSPDWINLAQYLSCALLGMVIGLYIAKYIDGKRLKKAFGYFIWLVAITIFVKEFI